MSLSEHLSLEIIKRSHKNGSPLDAIYALNLCTKLNDKSFGSILLNNYLPNKDSALKIASEYGSIEMAQLLIKHGANVHYEGNIALENSVRKGNFPMVKLLVNNGASVTEGSLVLFLAEFNKYDDIHTYLDSIICSEEQPVIKKTKYGMFHLIVVSVIFIFWRLYQIMY